MGGKTLRTQVALYLDDEKIRLLDKLKAKTGRTGQDLLREALDAMLIEHKLLKRSKRRP
jgi:predicted DNA-binding protein